jgi:hypothetical protein
MDLTDSEKRVTAKSAVGLLAVFCLMLSGGAAGPPKEKPTAAAPPPGKTLIYVYRKGRMLGAAVHPTVFVNDFFVGELHNSEYVSYAVDEGPVVVTTTDPVGGHLAAMSHVGTQRAQTPGVAGFWADLPGCKGLDWGRLALAPPADLTQCKTNLSALYQECGVVVSETVTGPVRITHVRVPECNYRLAGSNDALYLLTKALAARHVSVKAEAGKCYYLRWSVVFGTGNTLEMVDSAEGEKDLQGMHGAKER